MTSIDSPAKKYLDLEKTKDRVFLQTIDYIKELRNKDRQFSSYLFLISLPLNTYYDGMYEEKYKATEYIFNKAKKNSKLNEALNYIASKVKSNNKISESFSKLRLESHENRKEYDILAILG